MLAADAPVVAASGRTIVTSGSLLGPGSYAHSGSDAIIAPVAAKARDRDPPQISRNRQRPHVPTGIGSIVRRRSADERLREKEHRREENVLDRGPLAVARDPWDQLRMNV